MEPFRLESWSELLVDQVIECGRGVQHGVRLRGTGSTNHEYGIADARGKGRSTLDRLHGQIRGERIAQR